jgi:L-galactono-1,4-lactone dehydrogenase
MVEDKLMPPYHASWHWAKIEPPEDPARLAAMKARLAERFPVAAFNAARAQLDPNNILANDMVDKLFGRPGAAGAATAAA